MIIYAASTASSFPSFCGKGQMDTFKSLVHVTFINTSTGQSLKIGRLWNKYSRLRFERILTKSRTAIPESTVSLLLCIDLKILSSPYAYYRIIFILGQSELSPPRSGLSRFVPALVSPAPV